MATDVILDSSAVIALLNGEAGGASVSQFIGRGAVSAVNLAEVVSRFVDLDGKESTVLEAVHSLRLTTIPFDESQAVAAGFLRGETRRLGLSLGDRACLAAAMALDLPVVTADRAWRDLDVPVEIVVSR